MLPTPHALLLDFGGVIAEAPEALDWGPALVQSVNRLLAQAGVAAMPPEQIVSSVVGGSPEEDRFWLSWAPVQRDHGTYWGEVVAAGWPAPARQVVVRHAAALSCRLMELRYATAWQVRPGMGRLLAEANDRGLGLAVVSNTMCGAVHREFLDRVGLAGRFTAQLYSDEEGVRKPNPALAERAVAAVGADPARCWFVGDTLTRDVLVARRAGLGAAVLMRSIRVEPPPHPDGVVPDAVVADPVELHALLARHW
jgi:N-acetyl-D-muramate 6-phosphate phosphatase